MTPRPSAFLVVIVGLALLLRPLLPVDAQLAQNFYGRSCPKAERIVSGVVRAAVRNDRSKAASLLRLHFHDCFVMGCEGSVLLDSTRGHMGEKEALPNAKSLRAFEVIDQAKSALESTCPGVVSCADIMALAARDAVAYIGGPSWKVPTGRLDGTRYSADAANASLPSAIASYGHLRSNFANVGLNEKDLVVLSGAHTIGNAHCAIVMPRIYNFPGSKDGIDPLLNKAYAKQLKAACPPGSQKKLIPMDPSFGGHKFDNNYYANILNGKGLFRSDQALLGNSRGINQVITEISSPQANFFNDFGVSMEKMGRIGVLTDPTIGQIRKVCSRVNKKK